MDAVERKVSLIVNTQGIVAMKCNKDNQRKTLILETAAWTFVIGIVYIIAKIVY